MTEDNTLGDADSPSQTPPPRGPWSVTDYHGAPRADRARRVVWFAFMAIPGVMLLATGAVGALTGGSLVLTLGYAFAGATVLLTVWNYRTTYARGYAVGSLQRSLDRLAAVDLDDVIARPAPHPADPTPIPGSPAVAVRLLREDS